MANNKNFKVKNGLVASGCAVPTTTNTTYDLDLSSGSFFSKKLTDLNPSFTFSNPSPSGTACSFMLEVVGGKYNQGYSFDAPDTISLNTNYSFSHTITNLFFSGDGLRLYIRDLTGDAIHQYDLDPAWDIPSKTLVQTVTLADSTTGLWFKPDGTKMYTKASGGTMDEYDLSTAWDISTLSLNQSKTSGLPRNADFWISPDGLKYYGSDFISDTVSEYDFGTAWDISTLTLAYTSPDLDFYTPNIYGIFLSPDGTYLYISDRTNDSIYLKELSGPYGTISTSVLDAIDSAVDTSFIFLSTDGTKLYCPVGGVLQEYDINSPRRVDSLNFSSSVKWEDGSPPLAPPVGQRNLYAFLTVDGGSTYYAKTVEENAL